MCGGVWILCCIVSVEGMYICGEYVQYLCACVMGCAVAVCIRDGHVQQWYRILVLQTHKTKKMPSTNHISERGPLCSCVRALSKMPDIKAEAPHADCHAHYSL